QRDHGGADVEREQQRSKPAARLTACAAASVLGRHVAPPRSCVMVAMATGGEAAQFNDACVTSVCFQLAEKLTDSVDRMFPPASFEARRMSAGDVVLADV